VWLDGEIGKNFKRSFFTDIIQTYRQPMVTATEIFLGFMLNATSGWIPNAFTKEKFKDVVLAIAIILCLASLIVVLIRMLRMNYPVEPAKFYRRTQILFIIGITIPFLAFILIGVEKYIASFTHAAVVMC
jgi:hypothetical protein